MSARTIGIVGAGPAGISAAVQLVRSGLPVTLFEGRRPGGLIRNAWRVENLAVHRSLSGPALADILAERAHDSGAERVLARVTGVEYEASEDLFTVHTPDSVRRFHTLIMATGTCPRPWPLLDRLEASLRARVHREVADLDPAGQDWAVAGGGDAAFDYALTLAQGGGRVWLLVRGRYITALDRLQRALADRKDRIRLWLETEVTGIAAGRERPLELALSASGTRSLAVHGLVGAIGRQPTLPDMGPVLGERRDSLERKQRFWIIGDARAASRRQVGIALGSGLDAAMAIADGRYDPQGVS